MKKIYVTRRLSESVLELLRPECEIEMWDSDEPVHRAELVAGVAGKDGLLCLLTDKIDKDVLEAAGRQLKVVSTMSVGYDHIDLAECGRRGIQVGYTPGVLDDSVADLAIALMLATGRRLIEGAGAAREGVWSHWKPYWLTGRDLNHATVGIVGMGRIGATVARRLSGFETKILYTSRTRRNDLEAEFGIEHAPLEEVLRDSDFVSVHAPLTPDTAEMFGDQAFKVMKSTAIFVNTSRGGLVDQGALFRALRDGEIAGAGLDVTTPEPLPVDHELFSLPNCVILPHIGSAGIGTREQMGLLAAQNLLAGLAGKSLVQEVPKPQI